MEGEIAAIAADFALFDDWEERYAHILDLARTLPEMPDAERTEGTRVRGCASQVWFVAEADTDHPDVVFFRGDSDAHLVRGLIAILLRIYSGRTPKDILAAPPEVLFERLGLKDSLTAQRANGLRAMIDRIRAEAARRLS